MSQVRNAGIFNTYMPRMCIDDGQVVSNFVVQVLSGRILQLYREGDGKQTRSFQFFSDLVVRSCISDLFQLDVIIYLSNIYVVSGFFCFENGLNLDKLQCSQSFTLKVIPADITAFKLRNITGGGGLVKLMEGEHTSPFNLGNPGDFTMLELANVVQGMIDPNAKIEFEFRPNTARHHSGWEPKISLRDGLPLMRIFADHLDNDPSTTTTALTENGSF
ncbi:hypothetical protein ZIOFF_030991 [Zingiber officinale]|uniref:Uncharacterized protein n=1 Tax=Zingiber officinale TaxID=94328 RepID=A0A8J5GU67_ZINOF|nr:hypothetical protein ZIOFF_030991 [Zingiber officinale]